MGIRDYLAKKIFGDVIDSEIKSALDTGISEVESEQMQSRDYLSKALAEGALKAGNGTKQVLSEPGSISDEEGIFPLIPFDVLNRMYEETTWIRAGIDVIRRAFTSTGWTLAPLKEGASESNRDILLKFFMDPNPNDTMIEILDDIVRDLEVTGNAFVEIVWNVSRTRPMQLWNLNPDEMRVRIDPSGQIIGYVQVARGTRGFVAPKTGLRRVDEQAGRTVIAKPSSKDLDRATFKPDEVIHFKMGTKGSRIYGLAPLNSLVLAVTVDEFAQIYNKAFFKNGGKVRGMYFMQGASPEQVKRNRAVLADRAKRPELSHADLVLEGKVDWKQVGPSQKDMEFQQLRRFGRDEILAVLGVPPSLVSIIESGNIGAGTGDSQERNFYEQNIRPLQRRIAAKLTKILIMRGFEIEDWAFGFNPRPIDPEKQAKTLGALVLNGILTTDEARRRLGVREEVIKHANGNGAVAKRLKGTEETIVNVPRSFIELENAALRAFQRKFLEIKNEIRRRLRLLRRSEASKKLKKKGSLYREFTKFYKSFRFAYFVSYEFKKQLEEADEIVEAVKEERFVDLIVKYTGLAALAGLTLTKFRLGKTRGAGISAVLSSNQQEEILANARDLDLRLRDEIEGGVRAAINAGVLRGASIDDIRNDVTRALDSFEDIPVGPSLDAAGNVIRARHLRRLKRSPRSAVIVRTELNRFFNDGAVQGYRDAGETQAQFILSPTADDECIEAANQGVGGPSASSGSKEGNFFTIDEIVGLLPIHHNCFPPGTLVQGTFMGGFRAPYSGRLIQFKTRSGAVLSVTPNHPILTPDGFRPADSFCVGEDLVRYTPQHKPMAFKANEYHPPTPIEDVFRSLAVVGTHRQSIAPKDFHGDGRFMDGNVDIVGPTGKLLADAESNVPQMESRLISAGPTMQSTKKAGLRPGLSGRKRILGTPAGRPSSSALSFDETSIQLQSRPFQALRFGSASEIHASKYKSSIEDIAVEARFFAELKKRYSRFVFIDKIIEIRHEEFKGHVYDLQSPYGWIVANEVFFSNCRCTWAPLSRRA